MIGLHRVFCSAEHRARTAKTERKAVPRRSTRCRQARGQAFAVEVAPTLGPHARYGGGPWLPSCLPTWGVPVVPGGGGSAKMTGIKNNSRDSAVAVTAVR